MTIIYPDTFISALQTNTGVEEGGRGGRAVWSVSLFSHLGKGGPRFESCIRRYFIRSRIAETTGWMRARVFARAREAKKWN